MIRRVASLAASPAADKRALLRPLSSGRRLTGEVVARIAEEIRSGRLAPGARLPTEQELVTAMGVSRTVVREAVAALRADGLVTTRQGSGAFVAADGSRVPFRIDPDALSSIADVLNVMELRLAIEVEAAGLAAARIAPRTLGPIRRALNDMKGAIARGEDAVGEDFAFHRSIAAASANPRFSELLEFLGRHVIPRQRLRSTLTTAAEQRAYLARIQNEHARIHLAIKNGDPAAARAAMRAHLRGSLTRYRRLAERHALAP